MTKQDNARDWQKDMKLFEDGIKQSERLGFRPTLESSPYQVAIYWLQQAKAERERAEKAEELLKIILPYVPNTVRDTYDIDALLAVLDL